jgi:hypothetical protein
MLIRIELAPASLSMTKHEHILLESDLREVPDPQSARTVHARIEGRGRPRTRVLRLEIIDYYYLSVRSQSRSSLLEYVLDLRFVNPPQLSRHIAWRWIIASLLFMALVLGMAARIASSAIPWLQNNFFPVWAIVVTIWVCVTLVGIYRTTETATLRSTHGAAKLLELTAGLGRVRLARSFMISLAAHIRLSSAARRRMRTEHLRDEMREHLRLKELGVLSAEEYDASKVRILNEHSRTASNVAAKRPGRDA